MNQLEQISGMSNRVKSIRRMIGSMMLTALLFVAGMGSSQAQQITPPPRLDIIPASAPFVVASLVWQGRPTARNRSPARRSASPPAF